MRNIWSRPLAIAGAVALVAALGVGVLVSSAPSASAAGPASLAYPFGIACGSTSSCQVVGDTTSFAGLIFGTADAGVTWSQERVPSNLTFPDKLISRYVTCPSRSECLALGDQGNHPAILRTANGGVSWSAVSLPRALRKGYAAVACGSAAQCVAAAPYVSEFVIGTHNGGKSWSHEALPAGAGGGIPDMSCGSANHCQLVVGNSVLGTTNGGRTWVLEHLPKAVASANFDLVSCHSAGSCLATGNVSGSRVVSIRTANGGKSWTAGKVPGGAQQDVQLSCGSNSACLGIFITSSSVELLKTSNAGRSWSPVKLPSGFGAGDIACVSRTVCEAVGGDGTSAFALRTTNGGATWTVNPV